MMLSGGGGESVSAGSPSAHKPRTPPPDLPSLLLDARIVYLGMPLVPAVTELIIAELLYLQSADQGKPLYIYINSTGTTRADGETVGFETEGTAIYDTMQYLKNDVRPSPRDVMKNVISWDALCAAICPPPTRC